MMRRALVTGATGFIGRYLVKELLSRGWEITCLVRPESQTKLLRRIPVRVIKGPANDRRILEKALQDQDYVFHLAARIRGTSQHEYELANHRFTKDLVQACLTVNPVLKRFVYVSSIAAAGPSAPGLIHDETNPSSPVSEYGRTKLKGEEAVKAHWEKLSSTIIRPPNVYGAGQQETELLIKLIGKRIYPVLKERGKTTSLIYIKDLITGILQAALSPKAIQEIYFLTDGQFYSWKDIMFILKKKVSGDAITLPLYESVIFSAAFFFDLLKALHILSSPFGRRAWKAMTQRTWLFSSAKAVHDFGFSPKYTLETGVQDMLDHEKTSIIQRPPQKHDASPAD